MTASKSPSRFVGSPDVPTIAELASGCYLTDIRGQTYLDFSMALGACVLGYNHTEVNKAVIEAIGEGPLFTLSSYRETRTAEALLSHIPWAEQVRFGKTGTDVTTAAVRVARAYTNRDRILSHGYHGWADWSVAVTPPALGIPTSYNTVKLEWLGDLIPVSWDAAVIVEIAPKGEVTLNELSWLTDLRKECTKSGTVLIFDEVLSGFRSKMGSAVPEIIPDLACFGKSIGNGFSISALVGKRDIMSVLDIGGVFFSGTFFGETTGLAACEATLTHMDPKYLVYIAALLQTKINRAAGNGVWWMAEHGVWSGANGARVILSHPWTSTELDFFQQECAKRGILFMGGAHNLSLSHTEKHVNQVAGVYAEVSNLALNTPDLEAALEGTPSQIPYRMQ